MVSSGSFEHIGHASIRVEGSSACSVWLRVDHWPTALGRHPRWRYGVLYHVANRTLCFHGRCQGCGSVIALLFENWIFFVHPQLPSIRCSGSSVPPLDNPVVPEATPHSPMPATRNIASLRGIVRQLVDLCHDNQRNIRSLREETLNFRHVSVHPPILLFLHLLSSHNLPPAAAPIPPPPTASAILSSLPTFGVLGRCASLVSCGILSGPMYQP